MASYAAVLSVLVDVQAGKGSAALRKFNGELKAAEMQGSRSLRATEKFSRVVDTAAKVSAGLAAYGLYKAVKAGVTFERQMSNLAAVTGASERQMRSLERQALKLGESTAFTAKEVAVAQTELAKGGLSVKQIYGGGVSAALSLAAAGELDLGQAAETTVNAMKLFGLQGKDASKVADMLATAANTTTADVSDFALSLKQGGSVAKMAGLDLNGAVTVLEALAEAGIKGSDAGTSMKAFFLNITRDVPKAQEAMEELGLEIFNQQGRLKTLPAVSRELQDAFGDLTKEQFLQKAGVIAGSDAVRTLWALYDAGPAKLRKLQQANAEHGTAQEVARKKMDNFQGQLEELQGAAETLGIRIFQVLRPSLEAGAAEAHELVTEISRVFDDRTLSGPEKFSKAFSLAFDRLLPLFEDAMTGTAEVAAENSPKVAVAFVKGFLNAGIWGKLFTAAYLVGKIGGLGGFGKMGKGAGGKFAKGFIAGVLLFEMGKKLKEIAEGEELDAPRSEHFAMDLTKFFPDHKVTLPARGKAQLATDVGKLIFNPSTRRVIAAQGDKLKRFVGDTLNNKLANSIELLEAQTGSRAGNVVRTFRVKLKPMAGVSNRTGVDIKKSFLPKLDELVKGGGQKAEILKERVGGQFWDLAATTRGAMETIVYDVQKMLDALNLPKPKGFNAEKALKEMPELKPMGKQNRFSGGAITKPMAIVGEEAPRHNEWVIATNPAYRKNNLRYWEQAGSDLGVPGFAKGGNLARPEITGTEPLRSVGQGAVDILYQPAKALLEKLAKQATKGGTILSGSGPVEKVFANTARKLSRSKVATLALGMAGFAESGMRDLSYGHSTSQGSLQLLASTASSLGIDPHDEAAVASYFLTRGFWGKGSANSLAARGLPAHLVAQNVQGSAFEDGSNYLAQEGPAKQWMRRFRLLRRGGLFQGVQRLAGGGMVDVPGDSASGVVNSSIVDLVSAYARKFDTNINYGYDPGGGHVSPGHNVTGTATDIGPNQGSWTGAFEDGLRLLVSKGFEVLYGTDGIGISYPNHGRGNHAHVEWVGNGTTGDARQRLRAVLGDVAAGSGGPGLTEGQQTRREGKARKKAREAQLKKLREAVKEAKTDPAKQSKLWQLVKFWGRNGMFDKDERAKILGMVTQAASKTEISDSVHVLQNLAAYAGEHGEITGKDPDAWHSLIDAMNKAQERGQETRQKTLERQRQKRERRRNRKLAKIAERSEMPDLIARLEALRKATEQQEEFVSQLVTLEPEDLNDDYVGRERAGYLGVLGNLRTWRNATVSGRELATSRIQQFEDQIARIEAMAPASRVKGSKKGQGLFGSRSLEQHTYAQEKWKLPGFKQGIETLKSLRDDTLLGELEEISPLALFGVLGEIPTEPVAGMFGGRIFDIQNSIRELGLKGPDAITEAPDESERIARLEEMLREANQRNLVFERQKPVVDTYLSKNFAGMFAKGGHIPAGKWGVVGEAGPEPVRGPIDVMSNRDARDVFGGASATSVRVQIVEGAPEQTRVFVDEREVEGIVERMKRRQGREAKLRNPRVGRGIA